MNKQTLQHVKELFKKLEDSKTSTDFCPLALYVESDLYYRFKICCYTQNIEPFQAIKDFMSKTSSPQTVEIIKETLARAKD